jgi:hypothetical protein
LTILYEVNSFDGFKIAQLDCLLKWKKKLWKTEPCAWCGSRKLRRSKSWRDCWLSLPHRTKKDLGLIISICIG